MATPNTTLTTTTTNKSKSKKQPLAARCQQAVQQVAKQQQQRTAWSRSAGYYSLVFVLVFFTLIHDDISLRRNLLLLGTKNASVLQLQERVVYSAPHNNGNIVQSTIDQEDKSSFLDDAVKSKKQKKLRSSDIQIKIQYPVLVASLFKSGTTSVHKYFTCGKQRSVHYAGIPGDNTTRTGPCMLHNTRNGKPPFENCGLSTRNVPTVDGEELIIRHQYDIFADNNVLEPPNICYDPSIYSLDAMVEHYSSNFTIILAVRDSFSWIDSVQRYSKRLPRKLSRCKSLWPKQQQYLLERNGNSRDDDLENSSLTMEDIRQFYLYQINYVREFVQRHPSITYIEISLEDENAGHILEERVGIPAEQCWGNKNQNRKHTSSSSSSSSIINDS